ncbi:probable G-protein coupled receptor No9 [Gigantopelta aegis]|uniref:probable G-protein coupled receptor No9 n=1 Tax=Gigantopelta aegis TaxID=1735272 RepID=UPI001B88C17F|nr:probable G-protein coupled receptor No9 [Gigantopelta aegis]XP_041350248.1 probable G-protein coupled receptor No9 [Gigantopelta aegis]XP_041350249.1 probable G-protein coupled receptor No9 [Gigantopelta aegis]
MELTDVTPFFNTTVSPLPTNDNTTERFINIPAAVYGSILSVIGTTGNTAVLYVYIFKFKPNPFNIFITFLAACDILSCAVLMPLDVVNVLLPVSFSGCSPLVFIATATALATSFILVAIAALRYKGICKPLEPNISVVQAKRICLICSTIAVSISWPAAVMVTKIPDELEAGTFVMNCATERRFQDTVYPLLFYGFMFLLFVSVFVTLVALYGVIGRRLHLRMKYGPSQDYGTNGQNLYICQEGSQNASKNATDKGETQNVRTTSCSSKPGVESYVMKEKYEVNSQNNLAFSVESEMHCEPRGKMVEPGHGSGSDSSSSSTVLNHSSSNLVPIKNKPRRSSISKTTFKVLFIVTITFLVSYLPHLSLMLYESVGSDLDVTALGESFVGIFIRSYLISCVANPIIYGCCNRKFRHETNEILQKVRKGCAYGFK